MCWSSLYSDQFAVGYGSFHYQKQGTGAVSVFSLKNPSHAERTITTQSGEGIRSSIVSPVLKQRAFVLQLPAQACSERLCRSRVQLAPAHQLGDTNCLLAAASSLCKRKVAQAAVPAEHLMSSASVSAFYQV